MSGERGTGERRKSAQGGAYVYGGANWGRLDWVNGSMTLALWIRPDKDYKSGGGWQWSFGRDAGAARIWRLGYYGSGVRFEVHNASDASFAVASAMSLYAGRWYHLAATLGSQTVSLYVNGALAATANGPSAVRDLSNANLRLGSDPDGPTYYKGLADEFRLHKTALTQDAIRGLMWFLGGTNSVLIPRGVLYDSLLFKKMTNTSSDLMSGPLAGAQVRADTNGGAAHLNACAELHL